MCSNGVMSTIIEEFEYCNYLILSEVDIVMGVI